MTNRLYIILLGRIISLYIDCSVIIQKLRLCLASIEYLLIVGVNILLVTWKTVDRLLLDMWAGFLGRAKKWLPKRL